MPSQTSSKLPQEILSSTVNSPTSYDKMWALSQTDIQNLCNFLSSNGIISFIVNSVIDMKGFITSLKIYPFSIPSGLLDTSEALVLGNVTVKINDLTSLEVPPLNKNTLFCVGYYIQVPDYETGYNEHIFLQYEPFTKYELYVPFVGTIALKAKLIIGKTLTLRYAVDFHTGQSNVYLDNGNELIWTGSCTLGVDVPWGSTDLNQAAMGTYINCLKTIVGIAGGMPSSASISLGSSSSKTVDIETGAFSTSETSTIQQGRKTITTTNKTSYPASNRRAGDYKEAAYKYGADPTKGLLSGQPTMTTETSVHISPCNPASYVNAILSTPVDMAFSNCMTTSGDKSQFLTALKPFLIKTKMHIHDIFPSGSESLYGHYFGYPAADYIRLGDHHGYCEVSNIHMNGFSKATVEEKEAIETILHAGVFLPTVTP